MRFVIRAERIGEASWELVVLPPPPDETPICHRVIGCRSDAAGFPVPPDREVADLPASATHRELCESTDTRLIEKAFFEIAGRDPSTGAIERFGSYLFAVLLGEQAWESICARAGQEPIELSLLWPTSDWELTRLPWEMMRGPRGYLAVEAHRQVAITRLVPELRPRDGGVCIEPRALFVVGADLDDVAIRPGAEYLGLLRRLQSQGMSLNSRILLRATRQRLQDAIVGYRPSIVHFICHGGLDDNHHGYLILVSDEDAGKEERYFAEALLPVLAAGGDPPVVVLNACYAGTPPADRLVAPLAAELVKGGVPFAVGMAGRVADRACRLFTRRFYEALLQGESVAVAAAEGRRAGFVDGGDYSRNVDWAFPTLFLGQAVSPEVGMDTDLREMWTDREARALRYLTQLSPPFCDRLDLREDAYQELISRGSVRAARVLAVEVEGADKGSQAPRYGKTRLLEELAAQAVRDGHVPCLLAAYPTEEPPSTCLDLGLKILRGISDTRRLFGLQTRPPRDFEVFKLKQRLTDPGAAMDLHADVQQEIDLQSTQPGRGFAGSPKVVGAALRVDLEALAVEARAKLRFASQGLVLVLIDDVERFDAAAGALVEMLGPEGLGRPEDPVPVIFAFSGGVAEGELGTAILQLRGFLERKPWYVKHLRMRPFRHPADDPLPYQQFLLGQQPPLIVQSTAKEAYITDLFQLMHDYSQGAPSLLACERVTELLTHAKKWDLLEEADDDDILHRWRSASR